MIGNEKPKRGTILLLLAACWTFSFQIMSTTTIVVEAQQLRGSDEEVTVLDDVKTLPRQKQQHQESQQEDEEARYQQHRRVDEIFRAEDDDESVHAFVEYFSPLGRKHIENLIKGGKGNNVEEDLDEIQTMSVTMKKKELRDLQNDPGIGLIEKEEMVYLLSEKIPYGLTLTNGVGIPSASAPTGACNNPNAFKVALIDSGVQGRIDRSTVVVACVRRLSSPLNSHKPPFFSLTRRTSRPKMYS